MNVFKTGDKVKLSSFASKEVHDVLKETFGEGYKDMIYIISSTTFSNVNIKGCNKWSFGFGVFERYFEERVDNMEFKINDYVTLKNEKLNDTTKRIFRVVYGEDYEKRVYKIDKIYKENGLILKDCDDFFFMSDLFKKYTPKFKIGDKVKFSKKNKDESYLIYKLGEYYNKEFTVEEPKYKGFTVVQKDNIRIKVRTSILEIVKDEPKVKEQNKSDLDKILDIVNFKINPDNITTCKITDINSNKVSVGTATTSPFDKFDKRYGYIISLCRALELEEPKVKGIINVLYGELLLKEDLEKVINEALKKYIR